MTVREFEGLSQRSMQSLVGAVCLRLLFEYVTPIHV